jgi:hypothetical protein
MFRHVVSKNKTFHIYVFYIIFLYDDLIDSHFVTYNNFKHAMIFHPIWDHRRSNTPYSHLSLCLESYKVQYPVLRLIFHLSWDHPRSNTPYSHLSLFIWDHTRSDTLYSDLSFILAGIILGRILCTPTYLVV